MSLEETSYHIEGYNRRFYKQLETTRMIMYSIYCSVTEADKRLEIFDLFSIPGDPSEAERMNDVAAQHSSLIAQSKIFTEQVRAEKNKK